MRPKKKISQTDIAKALGVSNVTVSNALAGRKGVSDELIRKVRQTAAEMGYEAGRNNAGKDSAGKNGTGHGPDCIVIVTPAGGAAGRVERFAGLLQEQRIRVRYCTADEISGRENDGKYGLEACLGILVPEPLPTEKLLSLQKSGRPVIGVGFFDSHVTMDYVMDDGFHGAQLMVQYLREKGYERILYVKPEEDASVAETQRAMWEDRLFGYRSELYLETLNRGLTMEQAQPFDTEETRGILTLQDVRAYIENRQDGGQKCGDDRGQQERDCPRTAFFCGDMRTARAVQEYLAGRQASVPEEIGIAGYRTGECARHRGGDEAPAQDADERAIRPRTAERRITACENSEKNLLEQCCEILRDRHRGKVRSEEVHLVPGRITEGDTT